MSKNAIVSTWILVGLGVCAWIADPPAARPAQAGAIPAQGGAATQSVLPPETTVEAQYADGTPIPFKVPEQVAFLFVHNIGSLEKDPCMRYLERLDRKSTRLNSSH